MPATINGIEVIKVKDLMYMLQNADPDDRITVSIDVSKTQNAFKKIAAHCNQIKDAKSIVGAQQLAEMIELECYSEDDSKEVYICETSRTPDGVTINCIEA